MSELGVKWVLENILEYYFLFFLYFMIVVIIFMGIYENEVVKIMKCGNDYGNGGGGMKIRSADFYN